MALEPCPHGALSAWITGLAVLEESRYVSRAEGEAFVRTDGGPTLDLADADVMPHGALGGWLGPNGSARMAAAPLSQAAYALRDFVAPRSVSGPADRGVERLM